MSDKKLMVRGNSKLDKSILCFSLPPIVTCSNCADCKDTCYAVKSFNRWPNVKIAWEKNLAESRKDSFVEKIINQIKKSKTVKTVRIHVSGDFYSKKYITKWNEIIAACPDIQFYAYTKVQGKTVFAEICKNNNFNLIDSVAPDGLPNYGDRKRIDYLVSVGYEICPATEKKLGDITCGKDCNKCYTVKHVCFRQH